MAEKELEKLEDNRGEVVAAKYRNELTEIIDNFNDLKEKRNEIDDNPQKLRDFENKLRKKAANKVNNLISDVRKIIKHGQLLSPEERIRRSELKDVEKVQRAFDKQKREKRKREKEQERENRKWKRFAKYLNLGDEEPEERMAAQEPEDTESAILDDIPKETSINALVKQINDNIDDLDKEMADYAKQLARNIDSVKDEEEARTALDAALDGVTFQEYVSGDLKESFKNKIKKLFNL